jgi:DNA-binding response OmpR family regulator
VIILIVDDDKDDRSFLRDAIDEINCKAVVMEAESCRSAESLLKNDHYILPDYIFLDINMPVLNGKEWLRELRSRFDVGRLRVVIISTSSDPDEHRECYGLGAFKCITKPCSYAELVDSLQFLKPEKRATADMAR